jgi:cell division septal protein FtsQ
VTLPRRPVLVLGALVLAVGGFFGWNWFRDSALVKVRHVEISGVSKSPDGESIKRDLREATLEMTTLHIDTAKLEQAVNQYPIVRSVSAAGDFPSTVEVKVHEYAPVAELMGPDGRGVPVAFDGTLLPRTRKAKLPSVGVSKTPTEDGFETARVRALVQVLAGAPLQLRPDLVRAYLEEETGIEVAMRDGPTLEFGTTRRLEAKWAAATRVLAAPSSLGADAIDVRLPQRPSARGFESALNPQL